MARAAAGMCCLRSSFRRREKKLGPPIQPRRNRDGRTPSSGMINPCALVFHEGWRDQPRLDAAQRAKAAQQTEDAVARRFGLSDARQLHRPGFRYNTDSAGAAGLCRRRSRMNKCLQAYQSKRCGPVHCRTRRRPLHRGARISVGLWLPRSFAPDQRQIGLCAGPAPGRRRRCAC